MNISPIILSDLYKDFFSALDFSSHFLLSDNSAVSTCCNMALKVASVYKPLQQECHKIGKGVELAIETNVLIS